MLTEGFPACLGDESRTGQVNLEHEFEIFGAHLGESLVTQNAGIVDQHMNAAPFLLGVSDHLFHLIVFGHRTAVGHGFAAHGFDFLNHFQRHI